MKITYLTSFVTIALLSAVATANVIPAKIAQLPTIKRSPADIEDATGTFAGDVITKITSESLKLDESKTATDQSNVLKNLVAFRSIALDAPDIADIVPGNGLFLRGNSNEGGENNHHNNNNENDRRDIRYLNFFLLLEEFLTAFFERGLSRYSQQDFLRAGYPDWVRGRYEQIYKHEKIHKEFIQNAITASGGEYVRPCRYDFTDNDVHAFVDMSEALETISASAYTGSLQYISNKAYITTGASILAVEARHAAWINSAVRKQNPWDTAFETPLTPSEVITLLSNCFDFQSCPSGNSGLLPEGLRVAPRLSLPPRLVPGQVAEISFPNNNIAQGERLYAAFLTGIETIFVAVEERSENGGNYGSGNGGNENHNGNNGGQNNGNYGSGNGRNGSGSNGNDNHNNGGQNGGGQNGGGKNGGDQKGDGHNNGGQNGGGQNGDGHNNGGQNGGGQNGGGQNGGGQNGGGKNGGGQNGGGQNGGSHGAGNGSNGGGSNGNGSNGDQHGGDHNGNGNNGNNRDNEGNNRNNEGEHHDEGNNRDNDENNRNYQGNSGNNNQGNNGNNNGRRFFVEIPRDLEARGTVFVLIVRGPQNIREVSLNSEHVVAGPAIAMFPFDSNGKSIGW